MSHPGNGRPSPPPLARGMALFLDFDGTLVELAPRPDAVAVDDALRALLHRLATALPGRVAVVSGRALATLDALLGPDLAASLALAGSHGAELRAPRLAVADNRAAAAALAPATAELAAAAAAHGLLFEGKTLGAALHYRLTPDLAGVALAAAEDVARRHGLVLQHGKMMVEVRAAGDKGQAVERLMATQPFAGSTPIFLGDDVTDEEGFAAAARAGGWGVLVGPARAGAARYGLPDVTAVRAWLGARELA